MQVTSPEVQNRDVQLPPSVSGLPGLHCLPLRSRRLKELPEFKDWDIGPEWREAHGGGRSRRFPQACCARPHCPLQAPNDLGVHRALSALGEFMSFSRRPPPLSRKLWSSPWGIPGAPNAQPASGEATRLPTMHVRHVHPCLQGRRLAAPEPAARDRWQSCRGEWASAHVMHGSQR